MKKALFVYVLLILSSIPCLAEWKKEYYIRPGGIYTLERSTNTFTAFIKLGDTKQNALAQMSRKADLYGTTIDTFAFVDSKYEPEPCGLILYTYSVIVPPEQQEGVGVMSPFDNSSMNPAIKSISIYDARIRTLKGIGVGNTVKQLFDAHGNPGINWQGYGSNGWCMEYATKEGRIYFSVGQTSQITYDSIIGAIHLTY
ncbi:MAG: hypothetical protein ABRQ38_12805 [Candidatus Eremiobacterota bacterium]